MKIYNPSMLVCPVTLVDAVVAPKTASSCSCAEGDKQLHPHIWCSFDEPQEYSCVAIHHRHFFVWQSPEVILRFAWTVRVTTVLCSVSAIFSLSYFCRFAREIRHLPVTQKHRSAFQSPKLNGSAPDSARKVWQVAAGPTGARACGCPSDAVPCLTGTLHFTSVQCMCCLAPPFDLWNGFECNGSCSVGVV